MFLYEHVTVAETSKQFSSVQSLYRLVVGGHEGRFSRNPIPVFPARGPCEHSWHGQTCPPCDVVHPEFPLPTTASPTLHGAMRDGFGEAVVVCGMSEPCKFPSLDSCQKRILWTHKEADPVPLPVVGLVLQVGNEEKFPQALGFRVSKQGPCFTTMEEDGGDKRFVELELACEANGVAPPDPVQSGHC